MLLIVAAVAVTDAIAVDVAAAAVVVVVAAFLFVAVVAAGVVVAAGFNKFHIMNLSLSLCRQIADESFKIFFAAIALCCIGRRYFQRDLGCSFGCNGVFCVGIPQSEWFMMENPFNMFDSVISLF